MGKVNYYRNIVKIGYVEAQALWELENGYFILVDDDNFASVKANEESLKQFVPADIPEEIEKHL